MQLKEKKRRGAAMSSEARITKGDASEDALLTESTLLGPDNHTNAGGGGQDEQGEALVIPEKEEVVEKLINEPGVAVKSQFSLIGQKMAYEPTVRGKRRASPEFVARLMAKWAEEAAKSKKVHHRH